MDKKFVDIGSALLLRCPENDCIIFRNLYQMGVALERDMDQSLSEFGHRVLNREYESICRQMESLYYFNYAVQDFRKNLRMKMKVSVDK